jgi:glycosyltransferase involved in cell wall biosynthesis
MKMQMKSISVIMPCLNEADTLGVCIKKAFQGIKDSGVDGEVLVADNGSTDGSIEIAERLGARVVRVADKGYGNALMGGIAAAYGQFVIMGDADDSYDFLEVPKFVEKLQAGADLVQGCRLPSGGGTVKPGAMPFLHRWWGNPMFSFLVRVWFKAPVHDVYCGLRGFRKDFQQSLEQRCTGMEFATEMIIKSSLRGANIAEVPITLHPDGRKAHAPHLKTFRDGWRTLRFFLMCSPKWLFLLPGFFLLAVGAIATSLALPGVKIGPATFDAHTLLFGGLAFILGYQAVVFAIMTKAFAIGEGIMPLDRKLLRFFRFATLERGLILGGVGFVLGLGLLATAVYRWWQADFGVLDYSYTMRWVIPGATLSALGFQTILFSFFISMMGINRK